MKFVEPKVFLVGETRLVEEGLSAYLEHIGVPTWTTNAPSDAEKLCEVMGRHAGWIALHSGMAGGANVILIPEVEFDLDEVVGWVQSRFEASYAPIIVVAEGATPKGGQLVTKDATLAQAGELFHTHRIRHLPIVEGDRLWGILTDRATRQASPSSAAGISSQKLKLFIRAKAMSEAPICSGIIQFAKPTKAGMMAPNTMMRPCMVVSWLNNSGLTNCKPG